MKFGVWIKLVDVGWVGWYGMLVKVVGWITFLGGL